VIVKKKKKWTPDAKAVNVHVQSSAVLYIALLSADHRLQRISPLHE
jgi:hypothetical protein